MATDDPVLAGRALDGLRLHADLIAAGANLPAAPAIPADQKDTVLAITRAWLEWYGSLFDEPQASVPAWAADRLEYRFSVAAAGDPGSYVAQEYDGGSIEWHTFDRTTVKLAGGTAQAKTAFHARGHASLPETHYIQQDLVFGPYGIRN